MLVCPFIYHFGIFSSPFFLFYPRSFTFVQPRIDISSGHDLGEVLVMGQKSQSAIIVPFVEPVLLRNEGAKTNASCILAQGQKVGSGSNQHPPTPRRISRDRTKFAQILAPASHLVPPQKNNDGKMQQAHTPLQLPKMQ